MKQYLGMLRLPNLLIVVLTQYLIRFCVIRPLLKSQGVELQLGELNFLLLVLATVLIAVAGYFINDFFDIEIDKINKPGKNIVNTKIKAAFLKNLYFIINIIAIIIGFYLGYLLGAFQFGFIFLLTAIMLWFYSVKYKRQFFMGNFAVAILSALVIFLPWLFEFISLRSNPDEFINAYQVLHKINIFIWSYALFAFLTSIIREILKDMEDLKGDKEFGCRTIPVVIGVFKTKFVVGFFILISIATLAYGQVFMFSENFHMLFWYFMIAVQPLFIYLFIKTLKAKTSEDFNFLSNTSKIIMLAGILSMQILLVN